MNSGSPCGHPRLPAAAECALGEPHRAAVSRVRGVEVQHREPVLRRDVENAGLGVDGGPAPVGAAVDGRALDGALGAALDGSQRRREDWTELEVPHRLERHRPDLGGEVHQVVDGHALILERRRSGRKRLCQRRHLARQVGLLRHRAFLDRPDRVAGDPVEQIGEALLADLSQRADAAPLDGDVDQVGMGGKVPVPEAMVHRLEVPDALAGFDVDGDDRFREQIVARPVAAVVVVGDGAGRQIHVAQLID